MFSVMGSLTGRLRGVHSESIAAGSSADVRLATAYESTPAGGIMYIGESLSLNSQFLIDKPIHIIGGPGVVITFTTDKFIKITSDSVKLENISIKGTTTVRTSVPGIWVYNADKVHLHDCEVDAVSGAGILYEGSNHGSIRNCYVHDTLADGIHVTKGCTNITVSDCRCSDTGDDSFAVVSYTSAAICRDITFSNVLSLNSTTRGFAVAGGDNIKFDGMIRNPTLQGVIVNEDTTYVTYAPTDVNIRADIRDGLDKGVLIGRSAARVRLDVTVHNCVGRGVDINDATTPPTEITVIADIYGITSGEGFIVDHASNVNLPSVRVSNCSQHGIVLEANATNIVAGQFLSYNNNTSTTAGKDNIFIASSQTVISSIISVDDRGTPKIDRAIEINNGTDVYVGSYFVLGGLFVRSGTSTRVRTGIQFDQWAAATTPGSVQNKIEYFDKGGTSRGFIPLYDAIT